MGAMGRYIAGLTNEQRDRLITAQRWGHCGAGVTWPRPLPGNSWPSDGDCLTGHATGRVQYGGAQFYYDKACCLHGMDRVVRAIKLRAARLNGCDPATIAEIVAEKASTPVAR